MDNSEIRSIDIVPWRAKVGMVQQIEGFKPRLQADPFSQLNILEKREVQVGDSWCAKAVSSGVAVSAQSGVHKGRGVEPLVAGLVESRWIRVADPVGTLREPEVRKLQIVRGDRERKSC